MRLMVPTHTSRPHSIQNTAPEPLDQLAEKCRANETLLYLTVVESEKAFDSVGKSLKSLIGQGISEANVKLIKGFYLRCSYTAKLGSSRIRISISIKEGGGQGDTSPQRFPRRAWNKFQGHTLGTGLKLMKKDSTI